MQNDILTPSMENLRKEHVLMQAWKKSTNFIRYHNWYVDTLELDYATANLSSFISDTASSIQSPHHWTSDLLRIVPAPKSRPWQVDVDSGRWEPRPDDANEVGLRPLAHVSIRDQVVTTAILMCLADRVETLQGDPCESVRDAAVRKKVTSYGNRLFCDASSDMLRHRWGSAKLYRMYYQDYESFVARPTVVSEQVNQSRNEKIYLIHADLSQFYDRVRPELLVDAIRTVQTAEDDPQFFDFAARVLDWRWHPADEEEVEEYERASQLEGFGSVALPQGLASAGFFANVVLMAFDEDLRGCVDREILNGVSLEDACRYVDDLRIVVRARSSLDPTDLSLAIEGWLQELLSRSAPGLTIARQKTRVSELGSTEVPVVRQSAKMNRIKAAVSGGFDALGGLEILNSIRALMRSQGSFSRDRDARVWRLSPVADVQDETVARFSANRYRTTYRSIRPLLESSSLDERSGDRAGGAEDDGPVSWLPSSREVDDDARAFALSLIDQWIEDPSNVRLLRIGLDIWPDRGVLIAILDLLRPYTEYDAKQNESWRVACYCLSEILRAGATETGIVEDEECLPDNIVLQEYRDTLHIEALRLAGASVQSVPWYLRQQALLFLAITGPEEALDSGITADRESLRYLEFIAFLCGESSGLSATVFATYAVLARRSFLNSASSARALLGDLTSAHKAQIAIRDPSFALELTELDSTFANGLTTRIREDLCIDRRRTRPGFERLSSLVLPRNGSSPLRNELSILRFASFFLDEIRRLSEFEVVTPGQVLLKLGVDSSAPRDSQIAQIFDMRINRPRAADGRSIYAPPSWCVPNERWRFHLGFLIRFILTGNPDFTANPEGDDWKDRLSVYRQFKGPWYQRIYGLFSAQQAFSEDWLPISDWLEKFLLALLAWPGCKIPSDFVWATGRLSIARRRIAKRIAALEGLQDDGLEALLLQLSISRKPPSVKSFRACVVQTIVPTECDFKSSDITLSRRQIRRRHRNHLSAALAAVDRMLNLRKSHSGGDGRLDLLVLPELAVHPRDVQSHLVRFAQTHKCIIVAGSTYQKLVQYQSPVNSALWIIPKWSSQGGWQIVRRRQGKRNLAGPEKNLSLSGFRPCQWLIGYEWSKESDPLWLTAAVCYDATDLKLAAALRNQSDVFVIPALNKDVQTFDNMALALHYHMFQVVMVVNNGKYGGSSAYWPRHGEFEKQIFHSHGQPQASIGFMEIDNISDYLARGKRRPSLGPRRLVGWKTPPAGW